MVSIRQQVARRSSNASNKTRDEVTRHPASQNDRAAIAVIFVKSAN